jgi:hypothetical protein
VARIGKTPKRKKTTLATKDYQYPGEKMLYLQAMGGIWLLFLILAGYFAHSTFINGRSTFFHKPVGYELIAIALLYPAITIIGLNYLSQRPRKMELKKAGPRARVSPSNQPQLHKLVKDASTLLCMKQPELYVVQDEMPYLYAVPGRQGSIIMSDKCIEVLRPEELAAAVAKQLGHLKTGHVAVDLAITANRRANPLLQIICLPATLMGFLMRGWQDTIDYTGDRCSLLVARRLQTCTASMVKLAAAGVTVTRLGGARDKRREERKKARVGEAMTDREMAADEAEKVLAEVGPGELDAYLAGGGELTDDPIQVERAFKISRFIEQQRNLKDRIRNLGEWAETDHCEAALAKVDEIRGQLRSS